MMARNRRTFVQQTAAALASLARGDPKALALPANRRTGTIMDVEHVVILMQENRSFDHYFGTLRGVRGFSDPGPSRCLPANRYGSSRSGRRNRAPFHLDTGLTSAQWLASLDHSWKGSHALWQASRQLDRRQRPADHGFFRAGRLPFYYALADAFTICDAYHCSIFGPTNPNRLFLFSGTNGLAVGNDGPQAIVNPSDEVNETADQANDANLSRPMAGPPMPSG